MNAATQTTNSRAKSAKTGNGKAGKQSPAVDPKQTGDGAEVKDNPTPAPVETKGNLEPVSETRDGQLYMPGAEPLQIKKVLDKARTYANIRDNRIAVQQEEKKALESLDAVMKEHNLTEYHFEDVHVTTETTTTKKLKVKIGNEKPPKDDDDV